MHELRVETTVPRDDKGSYGIIDARCPVVLAWLESKGVKPEDLGAKAADEAAKAASLLALAVLRDESGFDVLPFESFLVLVAHKFNRKTGVFKASLRLKAAE